MRPSEQKKEWASLGVETACALLAEGTPTPEGHIAVDGQVRGYLRWYGDLTALKGYAPLAEAIAMGLQRKSFEKEDLDLIQSLYAREWETPVSYVHGAVHNAIQTAIDCHPAFASLVLGGVRGAVTTERFVLASMAWLTEYCLVHHYFSRDEREAAWQKAPRPTWDRPFISMEEKEIIAFIGQGGSFTALAETLNYPVERIELLYARAMERAADLLNTVPTQPLSEPTDDIVQGLKKIGFAPHTAGVPELRAAIRLSRDNPRLLDKIQDGLYTAVGEEVGMNPAVVSYRLRGALRMVYRLCRRTGQYADFYQDAGLLEQSFSVKRFIDAFLLYMSQLGPANGGEAAEAGKP